jgi:hypothetical protein
MLCLIVALTSCEQSTNPANDTSIKLAPADGTEVEGQAATDTATVWAYKTAGETSSWLFNCGTGGRGATINTSNTSANTIELDLKDDETAVPTEYWSNDKYTFFSLWPHVKGASATLGGNLTFDFNALTNQVDQLVSFNNYNFDGNAARTDAVYFTYDHALAKIYIKLTKNNANNDDDVKLRKVTLKGFYASGTCTVSDKIEWSGTGDNKKETTVVLFEATEGNALEMKDDEAYTVGATNDTDGGYLVIPQTVDGTIQLIVEYDFYRTSTAEEGVTPEREPKTISTYIPSNTIKTWKPGLKHTYNCILKAESSKILFTTPEIKPWGRQQVGGTIIIQ